VGGGTVAPFDGDLDDYRRLVLDRTAGSERQPSPAKTPPTESVQKQERPPASVRKRVTTLEEQIGKLENLIVRVDAALAEPDAFVREPHKAAQLATQRRDLKKALAAAEEEWLKLSSELEKA
jgi:ATP-binding cassette subfamily F protein 3